MKPETDKVERLVLSARQITQRVSLLFLLSLAAGLLLLGRAESVLVERLSLAIGNGVAPVLDAMTQSASGFRRGAEALRHYLFVFEENERLRTEVERLRAWEQAALRLEAENKGFRRILQAQPNGAIRFVTARTIGDASGPFVRAILVDAGLDAGVLRNQAVLTADGLVGRVVSLGGHAARVLLITDINSRIPVVLEQGRQHGVLTGDNTGRPVLDFLPPGTRPGLGERIVTSGDGGVFPPGLAVGSVAEVSEKGVRVQPFVDFDRLDYVKIAQFDLSLAVDDGRNAPADAPPMPQASGEGPGILPDLRSGPATKTPTKRRAGLQDGAGREFRKTKPAPASLARSPGRTAEREAR